MKVALVAVAKASECRTYSDGGCDDEEIALTAAYLLFEYATLGSSHGC